jgi:hypothetical protein
MKELPGVVAAVVAAGLPRWPLPPADNQTREEIEKEKTGLVWQLGQQLPTLFNPPHTDTRTLSVCVSHISAECISSPPFSVM